MIKTKKIKLAILSMFILIGVSLSLLSINTVETFAATTPKYRIEYNYDAKCNGYSQATGKSYNYAPKISATANQDFCIYITGDSSTGTQKDIALGSVFNFKNINISTTLSTNNITVYDTNNYPVFSGNGTSVSGTINDGNYTLKCSYTWSKTSRGVTTTWVYYFDTAFTVDLTGPVVTGVSKNKNEKIVNSNTYISATDLYSGVSSLYVKSPNETTFNRIGSDSYIITTNMQNGEYEFYAEDGVGNISERYYLTLDTVNPIGSIKNGNDIVINSTYINTDFYYSATDTMCGIKYYKYKTPLSENWQTYNSGEIISKNSSNGIYEFKAIDNAGNESQISTIILDSVKPTGTMYGGETIVDNNGKTNANYVSFVPEDNISGIKKIYVKKPSSNSYVTYDSGSKLTEEGMYRFYATDNVGNTSQTFYITVDRTAPVVGCLEADFYYVYGLGFTVSARDENGTATLYYKEPSSNTFEISKTNTYATNLESENGKYYFYAIDDLGNKSAIYWLDLQIVFPDPIIEQSITDNSVKVVWKNGSYATLNGDYYNKGDWITKEGDYVVVVISDYGLQTTKEFSITHNYVMEETKEPTCLEGGYSIFRCTSCNEELIENFKSATGHNYNFETVEPTCVSYGCIRHICIYCGDMYETDKTNALGHKYIDTTRDATCTEDGGQVHTCTVCGYEYLTEIEKATGHEYSTQVMISPHCETVGERYFHCDKCNDEYYTDIPCTGHNFELLETEVNDGKTTRTYICTNCGVIKQQDMGEQYEKVSSYIEYLFDEYSPYMVWVFIATAGVWSIVMGVFFAIAQKNEDKEKARKMMKNYIIGIVAIFCILVACPYLVKGIAALISG